MYFLCWFLLEQFEIQVVYFLFKNNMSFVVFVFIYFEWNVFQVLVNLSWDILYLFLVWERFIKVWLFKLYLKYQMDLVVIFSWLGLQELFQVLDLCGIFEQSLVVFGVQYQFILEFSEVGVEVVVVISIVMFCMFLFFFSVNCFFFFFYF